MTRDAHPALISEAEAEALLREARDDVAEASNHTHKPHAVAYYKDQLARIDAFLAADSASGCLGNAPHWWDINADTGLVECRLCHKLTTASQPEDAVK